MGIDQTHLFDAPADFQCALNAAKDLARFVLSVPDDLGSVKHWNCYYAQYVGVWEWRQPLLALFLQDNNCSINIEDLHKLHG